MAKFHSVCILLLYIFFFQPILYAQNDFEKTESEALTLFEAQDFVKSQQLYSLLLSQFPKKGEYAFRIGVCMLLSEADKKKPLNYLKRASADTEFNNPELYFYLGRAYQLNYRFEEAIPYFVEFKKRAKKALQREFKPDDYIAASLHGKYLISSSAELDIFSRKELQLEDYFRSYSSESMGGKLLLKPDDFKTKTDRKRRDKSVVYLPKQSTRVYFSSYGDEGLQRDIYVSERGKDGVFGKAQLVKGINSSQDDDFPFLHPNGKRLYFSSKGFNSMGGYDIFVSTWNESTSAWNAPENLEFPINSPDDDFLFVTDSTDQIATFSTTRMSAFGKVTVLTINNPNTVTIKDTIALAKVNSDAAAKESYLAQVIAKAELQVNHPITNLDNTADESDDPTSTLDVPQNNKITQVTDSTTSTKQKNNESAFSNSEIISMARQELHDISTHYQDVVQQINDAKSVSQKLTRESEDMLALARKQLTNAEANRPSANQKAILNEAQLVLQDALADSLTASKVSAYLQSLEREADVLNKEKALNQRYVYLLEQAQNKKSTVWLDSIGAVEEQLANLENQHVKKSNLANPIALQTTALPLLNSNSDASLQNQLYITVKQRDTLLPKIPSPLLSSDSIQLVISSKAQIQKLELQLESLLSKPITRQTEIQQVNAIIQAIAAEKKNFNYHLVQLYKQKIISSRNIITYKTIPSNFSSDFEYFENKLVSLQNRIVAFAGDSVINTAHQSVLNEADRIHLELSQFLSAHSQDIAAQDSTFSKVLTSYYNPKVLPQSIDHTKPLIVQNNKTQNPSQLVNTAYQHPISNQNPKIETANTNSVSTVKTTSVKTKKQKPLQKKPFADFAVLSTTQTPTTLNNIGKDSLNPNRLPAQQKPALSTSSTVNTPVYDTLNAIQVQTIAAIPSKTSAVLQNTISSTTPTLAPSKPNLNSSSNDSIATVHAQKRKTIKTSKRSLKSDTAYIAKSKTKSDTALISTQNVVNDALSISTTKTSKSTKRSKRLLKSDTAYIAKSKIINDTSFISTQNNKNDSLSISTTKTSKSTKRSKRLLKSDTAYIAKSKINDTLSTSLNSKEDINTKRKSNLTSSISKSDTTVKPNFDADSTHSQIAVTTKSTIIHPTDKTDQDAAVSASINIAPSSTNSITTHAVANTSDSKPTPTASIQQDTLLTATTFTLNSLNRDDDSGSVKSDTIKQFLDANKTPLKPISNKGKPKTKSSKIGAYTELAFPEGIVFRVQLAAVKKPITTLVFKNQDSVYVNLNTTNWYCYQKGNYFTYERALLIRNQVRQKGYKDAYIIVYNNGTYMKWSDYTTSKSRNVTPENTLKESAENTNSLVAEADIYYTIQLGVYAPKKKPAFTKFINPIFTEPLKNGNIRYYTSKLRTYKKAKLNLVQLQNAGFDDAFIKAFKNGKNISISESRTLEKPNAPELELQIKPR